MYGIPFPTRSDCWQQLEVIQTFQQPEGVSASNENRLGGSHRLLHVPRFVQRLHIVTQSREPFSHPRSISSVIVKRERNEENAPDVAEEITNLTFRIIKIAAAEERRGAKQKNSPEIVHELHFAAFLSPISYRSFGT